MKSLGYKKAYYAVFLYEPNVVKIFEKELADKIQLRCDDPNVTSEMDYLWDQVFVYYQVSNGLVNNF